MVIQIPARLSRRPRAEDESFANLQGNNPRIDKTKTVNKEERRKTYNYKRNRPPRGPHVMNVKHPSPPSSLRPRADLSLTDSNVSHATAISICDFVNAVRSSEFDLDDSTCIHYTPFCRVFLNENYETLRCQLLENATSFNKTQNRNFSYWRNG